MPKPARPERTQRATRASTPARTSQHPNAVRAAKRVARTKTTALTLGELADRYLRHLEARGATLSTRFSYHLELGVALDVLGRDTRVPDLTPERLAAFYACDRVMKTRTGAPKARVSVEKTRRVVRLAAGWAGEHGPVLSFGSVAAGTAELHPPLEPKGNQRPVTGGTVRGRSQSPQLSTPSHGPSLSTCNNYCRDNVKSAVSSRCVAAPKSVSRENHWQVARPSGTSMVL